MEIKIKKLIIDNFKKIKQMALNFNGENVNVYGDNETGKTTINDAFTWVLFGKDSLDRDDTNKDFEIKPKDANGNQVHHLETKVELILDVDGRELKLKRVFYEVYKGKRGNELEFDKNTTDFYINDVPKATKREYVDFINTLINEKTFKVLTNPTYFNELEWKEQREHLFKLAKEINDIDIVNNNPELKDLLPHIQNKTVEELKVYLKDEIKKAETKINNLEQQTKGIKKVEFAEENYNDDENTKLIQNANIKKEELLKSIGSNNFTSKVTEIKNTILSIQTNLRQLTSSKEELIIKAEKEKRDKINALKQQKTDAEFEIRKINLEKDSINKQIINYQKTLEEKNSSIANLRVDYQEEAVKEFIAEKCSYCHQDLPSEKVEELKKQFNLNKSNTLEKLTKDGKQLGNDIKEIQCLINSKKEELTNLDTKLNIKNGEVLSTNTNINTLENEVINIDTSKFDNEISKLNERIALLNKQLETVETTPQVNLFEDDLNQVKKELEELEQKRANYRAKKYQDETLSKIQNEQRDLIVQKENDISIKTLCDKFTSIKSSYLSEYINKLFNYAKFQFYNQLKESVEETCVCTVKGVRYGSVNNAGKIQAGLDIIKALQKVYSIKAPIFIDNAESITRYPQIESQLIKLYVSKNDKVLRFEIDSNEEE